MKSWLASFFLVLGVAWIALKESKVLTLFGLLLLPFLWLLSFPARLIYHLVEGLFQCLKTVILFPLYLLRDLIKAVLELVRLIVLGPFRIVQAVVEGVFTLIKRVLLLPIQVTGYLLETILAIVTVPMRLLGWKPAGTENHSSLSTPPLS